MNSSQRVSTSGLKTADLAKRTHQRKKCGTVPVGGGHSVQAHEAQKGVKNRRGTKQKKKVRLQGGPACVKKKPQRRERFKIALSENRKKKSGDRRVTEKLWGEGTN